MKESYVQSKIVKDLRARGYTVMKMSTVSLVGVPDLLIIGRGQIAVQFLEVKTSQGRLSPKQRAAHKLLQEQGAHVQVCYGYEHYDYLCDTLYPPRNPRYQRRAVSKPTSKVCGWSPTAPLPDKGG